MANCNEEDPQRNYISGLNVRIEWWMSDSGTSCDWQLAFQGTQLWGPTSQRMDDKHFRDWIFVDIIQ